MGPCTSCVGLGGLLGDVTTFKALLIGAFFSGFFGAPCSMTLLIGVTMLVGGTFFSCGLLAPCEGLGGLCLMTLLLIEVTTLTAELKGASLAVNGIVWCMTLLKAGLFWLPPGPGLLNTRGGLGGLGATGLLFSTTGSFPINLRKQR